VRPISSAAPANEGGEAQYGSDGAEREEGQIGEDIEGGIPEWVLTEIHEEG
jgi:hypothetical protein